MTKKPPQVLIRLEKIESKIFVLRGDRLMLDRDLAELYGVETRALNQAVTRNADRFPDDLMFQLTAGGEQSCVTFKITNCDLEAGRKY